MTRPVLAVVAQQQNIIESLKSQVAKQDLIIDYIANVAGLTSRVAAIRSTADAMNPGQPVPDPASQPAAETTEQAVTPEAYDSPLNPGQTPGSVANVPADATGTPMDPGTTLPTSPYNNLQDVTAPVAGTETHVPNEQTRTEVDVRVGDPMNPERAFPWGISQDAQGAQKAASQGRTIASLRLARLRMQAGTAQGTDDISVAASIEADASLSTEAIESEIATLAGVVKAASARTQRPGNLVPRAASAVQRTTPSLVNGGSAPMQVEASVASEDDAEDIFL